MKFLWPGVVVLLLLSVSLARAAEPIEVEIHSIEEQGGRITGIVSATGPDGKPISGLTQNEFKATLDGEPVLVSGAQTVADARASAAIVLAVDVSGSMAGVPIQMAKQGMLDFVEGLDRGDQVALMSFAASVETVQRFTSDSGLLNEAIIGLVAGGETVLHTAVIEASTLAGDRNASRKLIVLLSDGISNVDEDKAKREESIEIAAAAGVPIIAIGLGSDIDTDYLSAIADASGGRFIAAPTATSLGDTYTELVAVIRGQYVVRIAVPQGTDRSVPSELRISVTDGVNDGFAVLTLEPLAGATPPPFDIEVSGFDSGTELIANATLSVAPPDNVILSSVQYSIDGEVVQSDDAPPFTFDLSPSLFSVGNHIVSIEARDEGGRVGFREVIVAIPAPPAEGSLPKLPVLPIAAAALAVLALFLLVRRIRRRRPPPTEQFTSRIKPWAGRVPDAVVPIAVPRDPNAPLPPAPVAEDKLRGRLIVMNEASILAGDLGVQEYEMRSTPLTIGSSPSCQVVLEDPDGRIAGEEARVWVQRGRLVYHRLTTLSAMATEGVTSGWQLLSDADELQVGPYRLTFRPAEEAAPEPQPQPQPQIGLRELWPRLSEESGPVQANPE